MSRTTMRSLIANEARSTGKLTMTLNLPDREMAVLDDLCGATGLSKTGVLRQALRLYQWHHEHAKQGGTVAYSGGLYPSPMMLQPGFGEPPRAALEGET